MRDLVLSVFPGIDVLGIGFEFESYVVLRGPDPMFGRLHDVRRFHPPAGIFAHSRLAAVVRARWGEDKVADDLIPEFARVVMEAQPDWWLMENVPHAPAPRVNGYAVHSFLLNNRWLGGVQNRLRRFWFGVHGTDPVDLRHWLEYAALEPAEWKPAVLASGRWRSKRKTGPTRASVREGLQLQGLPEDFFDGTPFTVAGQQRLVGNAVPLPMARALARAIRKWEMAVSRHSTEVHCGVAQE